MPLIEIRNLTFGYDGSRDNVFEDVSLRLDTGWKLGLIGRNGRGKTTLLRLLAGQYEYRGDILSPAAFDYFPFAVGDEACDTLEVISKIAPGAELWRLKRELSLLGVCEDALYRPFATLSNGEKTKALLAVLFSREGRFPLIDEPTNHLDMEARQAAAEYLGQKEGFILVSHDRTFLDCCTDHIMSINKTGIEVQKGDFSSWQRNRDMRDSFEAAENARLKKDVKRLEEAAGRAAAWSGKLEKTKYGTLNSGLKADRGYIGHKSAKMMKRSKAASARREKALEEKSRLLKDVERADSLSLNPLTYHSRVLIETSGLSVSYGGRTVCENIGFSVERGDRVALTGKNGCGKSSVLKLLTGMDIPYSGVVRAGGGLAISYVPQDASSLSGGLKELSRDGGVDESLFKTILRKLGFSREQLEKDTCELSGGQKKKVLLAKSLCERAHLYVWDEPLNYVDVLSRMQLESLILESRPTMLFVEHDGAFLSAVATKRVAL